MKIIVKILGMLCAVAPSIVIICLVRILIGLDAFNLDQVCSSTGKLVFLCRYFSLAGIFATLSCSAFLKLPPMKNDKIRPFYIAFLIGWSVSFIIMLVHKGPL